VESLADMTPEQLEAIEGIGPKTVEKISIAVNNYFASLDGGEAVAAEPEDTGEAESPADGELEAARLAAEAEPADTAPAGEDAEAATEDAPEDKQN